MTEDNNIPGTAFANLLADNFHKAFEGIRELEKKINKIEVHIGMYEIEDDYTVASVENRLNAFDKLIYGALNIIERLEDTHAPERLRNLTDRIDRLEKNLGESNEKIGLKVRAFSLFDRVELLEEDMDNNDVNIRETNERLEKIEQEVGQQLTDTILNLKARVEGLEYNSSREEKKEEPYLILTEKQCRYLIDIYIYEKPNNMSPKEFFLYILSEC